MSNPDEVKDTADLLAEAEADGQADPNPEPITDPDDPDYVEPYREATPVEEEDEEGDG